MNLGTQLKWFHNFWTSTQVAKIHQNSARKLIYNPLLDFLEKETELLGMARNNTKAAQPRGLTACSARTRPTQ
jgi:hypothetical protein